MTIIKNSDLYCLPAGKRFCSKGMRQWFQDNGLDYDRFLQSGLPEEEVAHIADPRLQLVLAKARAREAAE